MVNHQKYILCNSVVVTLVALVHRSFVIRMCIYIHTIKPHSQGSIIYLLIYLSVCGVLGSTYHEEQGRAVGLPGQQMAPGGEQTAPRGRRCAGRRILELKLPRLPQRRACTASR